jgi:hypothetical protein
VWTGSKMLVWGGRGAVSFLNTGGVYSNPVVLPPGADFFTVLPCRVFDTRALTGPTLGAPIACGIEESFAVAGKCGVFSSVKAVSVNLTGTGFTAQHRVLRRRDRDRSSPFRTTWPGRPGRTTRWPLSEPTGGSPSSARRRARHTWS